MGTGEVAMAEATPNVYQRLFEAQRHIVAPRQSSRFRGGSRSAEQILEAAKPACRGAGLLLVVTEEVEFIGERNRIRVTATVHNVDNPEESISAASSAWEGEVSAGLDTSQVSGKTGSYAKKYALQNLFAIDDTKDADFEHDDTEQVKQVMGGGDEVQPAPKPAPVSADPLDALRDELADLMRPKFTSKQIHAAMGKLETEADFKDAIAKMKAGSS